MTTRMLIDATHSEETRVVVIKGTRLEEFDYESSTKKQLKGNIYLAKVTRVEPALQAAFVDYGGNRHGFLAFSEIHPDYYQIPVEDRQALLEEEAAAEEEEAAARNKAASAKSAPSVSDEASADSETENEAEDERDAASPPAEGAEEAKQHADDEHDHDDEIEIGQPSDASVETVGAEDDLEDVTKRRARRSRRYKIQEVIRRRQILLVQVVKEERGNKGAALTTYLSLAGRFCVLMPNTARGGGISRKIANVKDRKRLKGIIDALELPDGMGVIVRTAGMEQNKREIKRDYDYLIRLWDTIREQTLQSSAPALIHEEGNLIKRTIRDLYSKDIDEVLVEGDEGYRTAKEFMRMLMPSHAKMVQPYKENIPLFARYQVEGQLDSMFSPTVHLKSGGYIVINSTEALVAVDVNSGRATREHNIEETALKTNMEAAEEVARQLRLRDLAGLVVIDFIDMEKHQNNRSVERRLKDRLKYDRARIQVGRISAFGLLEMSRQRLRPGLLEATTTVCSHCAGTGIVRSTESSALQILRAIEEEGIRGRSDAVTVHAPPTVMSYLLNQKRSAINDICQRYNLAVNVLANDELIAPNFTIDRSHRAGGEIEAIEAPAEEKAPSRPAASAQDEEQEDGRKGRRRRRGRRRRGHGGEDAADEMSVTAAEHAETDADDAAEAEEGDARAEDNDQNAGEQEAADGNDGASEEQGKPKSRRRRGRRGGRSRRRGGDRTAAVGEDGEPLEAAAQEAGDSTSEDAANPDVPGSDETVTSEEKSISSDSEATETAVSEAVAVDEPVSEPAPAPEPVASEALAPASTEAQRELEVVARRRYRS